MINGLKRFGVNNEWLLRAVDYYLERHNLGNRGKGDGNKSEQRAGLIAEMTIHKFLKGVYPNLNTKPDGFDGGFDFLYRGATVDVKTKQRTVYVEPHYKCSLYEYQLKYDCDIFIFCSFHKNDLVVEICGWIEKENFLSLATYYPAGSEVSRDTYNPLILKHADYQIEISALNKIENIFKINLEAT